VQLKGVADFVSQLLPRFEREIDVLVCPHQLGDPSCAYVESLACGVPVVGYANEAWGLLSSTADVGRTAPLDDIIRLARLVAALHADRETLARLSLQAWNFGQEHTREQMLAARIEHLRQCAERPIAECGVAAALAGG
jgi:hypothetical protein